MREESEMTDDREESESKHGFRETEEVDCFTENKTVKQAIWKLDKILFEFSIDQLSFLLTHIFWCYQIWKNLENILQKIFYVETNGTLIWKVVDVMWPKLWIWTGQLQPMGVNSEFFGKPLNCFDRVSIFHTILCHTILINPLYIIKWQHFNNLL